MTITQYNPNDMKNLFTNDNKEKEKFRKFIIKKYVKDSKNSNDFLTEMSADDIIDWYFKSYDFYEFNMFIQCNKKLSDFSFKNQNFVKVQIYKNDEGITYFSLSLSNFKKDYLTLEEALEDIQINSDSGLFKLPKKSYSYGDGETISKMLKTTDDFYGNYIQNGKECCSAWFSHSYSNLDICSITLGGNDDYSITSRFFSKKEADKVWKKLIAKKSVVKEDLPNHFFSN